MRVCFSGCFVAAVTCCFTVPCWGQGPSVQPRSEPLVTDRPDFTESALTVPKGLSQGEFGVTTTRAGDDRETGFGELLLRIGIHQRMELRVVAPTYLSTRTGIGRSSGFSDASIGFKFSLARAGEQTGLRQYDVGLIVATTLPTGSSAYREKQLQPGMKLLLASALTEKIGVSANFNYDSLRENGDRYGEFAGSLSFGFGVTDRTGIYAEYFGFYPTGDGRSDTNYLNTGVTYLVSNDFQLDARVGKGLNGISNDYFIGTGASVRY